MAASGASASTLQMQHQIRANAAQLQDYFSDLYSWERSINEEEAARTKRSASDTATTPEAAAIPAPRRRVQQKTDATPAHGTGDKVHDKAAATKADPAGHTYDKGYSKWAKFDVDAALREADEDNTSSKDATSTTAATKKSDSKAVAVEEPRAAAAKASVSTKSREELEREDGNAHYQRGDYVAAIKCYTQCLGYNPRNAVVLSNRAMAHLKNREFGKAEDDCNLALKIDPNHLKSLSRRGTARNSLGKHRLALLDFERAAELDPKSRQIQTQIASTRELIRTAIKRAPKRTQFKIEVIGKTTNESHHGTLDDLEDKNSVGNKPTTPIATTKQRSAVSEKPSQEAQLQASSPPTTTPAPVAETSSSKPTVILPKLPKKAPTTSYEFGRVWKTLAPKGDAERQKALLGLRAEYLRLIQPAALGTIFKNSIEAEILCDIFHVFRHAMQATSADKRFVLDFAMGLAKVPRFSMAVMFLSVCEKEDLVWVVERLRSDGKEMNDDQQAREVDTLAKLYALQ
ncbi:Rna polymerase ii-associated protein, partial [Globisporangium splendens]